MAKEDLSLESEATEDELDAGGGKCKSELAEYSPERRLQYFNPPSTS
jgi:hypothetical protein